MGLTLICYSNSTVNSYEHEVVYTSLQQFNLFLRAQQLFFSMENSIYPSQLGNVKQRKQK